MWTVYIVKCADGTYYTGIAKHLQPRIDAHNAGKGAKYTKTRLPVRLVYQEKSENRSTASMREHAIKRLSRTEKRSLLNLAAGQNPVLVKDDLTGPEIIELLEQHLADAYANSPPGSVHALDLPALRGPNVTFWSVWDGGNLMGCGALKRIDDQHGEVKSMRTHADYLRKGVGALVLSHIIEQARKSGFKHLSLETGSNEAYAPARALYTRFGFVECGPFADYEVDDFSFFMTLELAN